MKVASLGGLVGASGAAILVLLFGGNLALYLYVAGFLPVQPFIFVLVLTACAAALFLSSSQRRAIHAWPLVFWCFAYVVLNTLYFLVSSQSEAVYQEYITRLMSAAYLVVAMLIFATPVARRMAARCFAFVLVTGVILNVVDILNPNTFSIVVGRAAGLYLNPNIAAGALIGTFLILIAAYPRQRMLWLTIGSLGVLLTLSRGGLVTWAIVVVVLLLRGTIQLGRAIRWVAAVAVILVVAGMSGYLDPILLAFTSSTAFATRISAFAMSQSASDLGDVSIPMRLLAAREALTLFQAHPILGAGIGATTEWALSIYPHNIYLRQLAEHGLFGVIIYPSFVIAATWRMPRGVRLPCMAFWATLGLFDHNVLDNRALLTIAAFAAAWLPRDPSRLDQAGVAPGTPFQGDQSRELQPPAKRQQATI